MSDKPQQSFATKQKIADVSSALAAAKNNPSVMLGIRERIAELRNTPGVDPDELDQLERGFNSVESEIEVKGPEGAVKKDEAVVKPVSFSDDMSLSEFKTQMSAVRVQFNSSISNYAQAVQQKGGAIQNAHQLINQQQPGATAVKLNDQQLQAVVCDDAELGLRRDAKQAKDNLEAGHMHALRKADTLEDRLVEQEKAEETLRKEMSRLREERAKAAKASIEEKRLQEAQQQALERQRKLKEAKKKLEEESKEYRGELRRNDAVLEEKRPELERIAEADEQRLAVLRHQRDQAGQKRLDKDVKRLEETKVEAGFSREVEAMQAQQEAKTAEREEKAAAIKLQAVARMMAAKKEARRLREEQQRAGGWPPTQESSKASTVAEGATSFTAEVKSLVETLTAKPEKATTGPLSPSSTPKARGQTREASKGRGA